MYLKNRRHSSKLEGYSPLQLTCNLTGMKPAIDYNYYAKRCEHYGKPPSHIQANLVFSTQMPKLTIKRI